MRCDMQEWLKGDGLGLEMKKQGLLYFDIKKQSTFGRGIMVIYK